MNILWCGGEDIDFPNGASLGVSTDSALFRASFNVRCALINTSGSRSNNFAEGGVTSGWCSRYCGNSSPSSLTSSVRLLGLVKDSTTSDGIYIGVSSLARTKLVLYKYVGTTMTSLATESGASLAGNLKLHLNVENYGSSATVKVFANDNLVIEYTGDISISGVSDFKAVAVGSSGAYYCISEVIVADSDTRAISGLATLAIDGAGDANAGTGTYADIDEITNSDADLWYTDTTNAEAQFATSGMPTGTYSVLAVKVTSRGAKSSGATPQTLSLGVKTNSTVNAETGQALDTVFATKERLMASNPVTASAWTTSEINALQLNLKAAA